jgi:hypothetical protein
VGSCDELPGIRRPGRTPMPSSFPLTPFTPPNGQRPSSWQVLPREPAFPPSVGPRNPTQRLAIGDRMIADIITPQNWSGSMPLENAIHHLGNATLSRMHAHPGNNELAALAESVLSLPNACSHPRIAMNPFAKRLLFVEMHGRSQRSAAQDDSWARGRHQNPGMIGWRQRRWLWLLIRGSRPEQERAMPACIPGTNGAAAPRGPAGDVPQGPVPHIVLMCAHGGGQ